MSQNRSMTLHPSTHTHTRSLNTLPLHYLKNGVTLDVSKAEAGVATPIPARLSVRPLAHETITRGKNTRTTFG